MVSAIGGNVRLGPVLRPLQENRMQWVIDRLEGEFAVCENDRREVRDIPLSQLPPGASPGDVLRVRGGVWQVDAEETRRRKADIVDLTKDLWG